MVRTDHLDRWAPTERASLGDFDFSEDTYPLPGQSAPAPLGYEAAPPPWLAADTQPAALAVVALADKQQRAPTALANLLVAAGIVAAALGVAFLLLP